MQYEGGQKPNPTDAHFLFMPHRPGLAWIRWGRARLGHRKIKKSIEKNIFRLCDTGVSIPTESWASYYGNEEMRLCIECMRCTVHETTRVATNATSVKKSNFPRAGRCSFNAAKLPAYTQLTCRLVNILVGIRQQSLQRVHHLDSNRQMIKTVNFRRPKKSSYYQPSVSDFDTLPGYFYLASFPGTTVWTCQVTLSHTKPLYATGLTVRADYPMCTILAGNWL